MLSAVARGRRPAFRPATGSPSLPRRGRSFQHRALPGDQVLPACCWALTEEKSNAFRESLSDRSSTGFTRPLRLACDTNRDRSIAVIFCPSKEASDGTYRSTSPTAEQDRRVGRSHPCGPSSTRPDSRYSRTNWRGRCAGRSGAPWSPAGSLSWLVVDIVLRRLAPISPAVFTRTPGSARIVCESSDRPGRRAVRDRGSRLRNLSRCAGMNLWSGCRSTNWICRPRRS